MLVPSPLCAHRILKCVPGADCLCRRQMLNDMERHQIAREIWLHIQLNHPSIIALYAAWKDRDYIYLVLEWAPEVGLPRLCWHDTLSCSWFLLEMTLSACSMLSRPT